jgi:hypothetical protein
MNFHIDLIVNLIFNTNKHYQHVKFIVTTYWNYE